MIKYIGIAVTLLGLALLALSLFLAKKQGAKEAQDELKLILESGYAATHREAKAAARPPEEKAGGIKINAAPKKRTLSKEAKEILARVEEERAAEKEIPHTESNESSGTDIMERRPERLRENKETDILDRKPSSDKTDVMDDRKDSRNSTKGGTDVLDRGRAPEKEGKDSTDVLVREKPAGRRDRTDVMKRDREKENGQSTDILIRRKKKAPVSDPTDVLDRKKSSSDQDRTDVMKKDGKREKQQSTDILVRKKASEKNSTDVLERRTSGFYPEKDVSGTDILDRRETSDAEDTGGGTDILIRKKAKENSTDRKKGDM